MQSRVDNSDAKVRGLKLKRKAKPNEVKLSMNHNKFRRIMKKVLEFASSARDIAKRVQNQKVAWVRKKYGKHVDDFFVPENISEFKECYVFKNDPKVEREDPSGPVVVCRD